MLAADDDPKTGVGRFALGAKHGRIQEFDALGGVGSMFAAAGVGVYGRHVHHDLARMDAVQDAVRAPDEGHDGLVVAEAVHDDVRVAHGFGGCRRLRGALFYQWCGSLWCAVPDRHGVACLKQVADHAAAHDTDAEIRYLLHNSLSNSLWIAGNPTLIVGCLFRLAF